MLGMHCQLYRGQMSHICDISPLRINSVIKRNETLLVQYRLHHLKLTDADP